MSRADQAWECSPTLQCLLLSTSARSTLLVVQALNV